MDQIKRPLTRDELSAVLRSCAEAKLEDKVEKTLVKIFSLMLGENWNKAEKVNPQSCCIPKHQTKQILNYVSGQITPTMRPGWMMTWCNVGPSSYEENDEPATRHMRKNPLFAAPYGKGAT